MSAAATPPAGSSVEDRVRRVVCDHLGVEEDRVRLETALKDDLGADSLDRIELLMAVEEEFGIGITDAAAEGFVRVCDVVAYVERALASKAS